MQDRFQLHLGDCVEGMRAMEDKSVDVAICDPEYSEHIHKCGRRGNTGYDGDTGRASISRNRELGFEHLTDDRRRSYAEHYARLARRWVLVFCDVEGRHLWEDDLERAGLQYVRTCHWIKLGATPQFTGDRPAEAIEEVVCAHQPGRKRWNGGGKHNTYPFPIVLNRGGGDPRLHPTQKPLALMRALVQDFTDPDDLILDSHAGSGTTGLAALELGRRFIGFEMDPKHHATAMERLRNAQKQEQLFFAKPMKQMPLTGAA